MWKRQTCAPAPYSFLRLKPLSPCCHLQVAPTSSSQVVRCLFCQESFPSHRKHLPVLEGLKVTLVEKLQEGPRQRRLPAETPEALGQAHRKSLNSSVFPARHSPGEGARPQPSQGCSSPKQEASFPTSLCFPFSLFPLSYSTLTPLVQDPSFGEEETEAPRETGVVQGHSPMMTRWTPAPVIRINHFTKHLCTSARVS